MFIGYYLGGKKSHICYTMMEKYHNLNNVAFISFSHEGKIKYKTYDLIGIGELEKLNWMNRIKNI